MSKKKRGGTEQVEVFVENYDDREQVEELVQIGDDSEEIEFKPTDSLLYELNGKNVEQIVIPVEDDDPAQARRGAGCLTCCFIIFLFTGAVLLTVDSFQGPNRRSDVYIAGTVITMFAAICIFPLCCLSCCSPAPRKKGNKEKLSVDQRFELRRLNKLWHSRQKLTFVNDFNSKLTAFSKGAVKKVWDKAKKEEEIKKSIAQKQVDATIRAELSENPHLTLKELSGILEPTVYVIRFTGDMTVSGMGTLRDQISMILQLVNPKDEVVVVLNSPGGLVQSYGLAAAQLARIKEKNIKLTVCVDLFAASGGYMMAVVADKILAAPFALVGSIGVVSYMANFQRLLDDKKIDTFVFTAGEYKRTVDFVGDVTEVGIAKQKEELEMMHEAFKKHCAKYRPSLDIEVVATGEAWLAMDGLEKGLVDELMTSDEYILQKCENYDVYEVALKKDKDQNPLAKLLSNQSEVMENWTDKVYEGILSFVKGGQQRFRAVA